MAEGGALDTRHLLLQLLLLMCGAASYCGLVAGGKGMQQDLCSWRHARSWVLGPGKLKPPSFLPLIRREQKPELQPKPRAHTVSYFCQRQAPMYCCCAAL